jgi:hypothetical protein
MKSTKLVMMLGAMVVAAGMGGCTIEDWVRAPVPKPIQAELGVPAEVPSSQMPEIREQYAQAMADKAQAEAAKRAEAVRQIESKARSVASGYAAKIAQLQAQQAAELAEYTEAGARELAKLETQAAEAEASARRALTALAASEARAATKVETINKLIGGIAEVVAPGITAAFPAAGPLLGLGLAAFAYTRKRPGEDARVAEEKQDSYNKGKRDALALASAGNAQMANGQIVK